MEREVAAEGRFFKVMLPGFHQKLSLPRAFCKKLEEDEPEGAILESRKGTWKIETCRNSEGVISFKDGWPEFAHNHNLSVGDFVVFEHTGELHFNVVVFGRNACEKELPVGSKRAAIEAGKPNCLPRKTSSKSLFGTETHLHIAGETSFCSKKIKSKSLSSLNEKFGAIEKEFPVRSKREAGKPNCFPTKIRRANKKSGVSHHSKDPYFVVTMTPFIARICGKVTIPMEFVSSNDLGEKTSASLRNPAGEVWVAKLQNERSPRRCRMSTGWHGFHVANDLQDGDVCVFVLNRRTRTPSTTVSFDVKIIRASARK